MPAKTIQNVRTLIVGTAPVNILPISPRRKSFILSPITAIGNPGQLTTLATVFGRGTSQPWVVPAGVTDVLAMYLWGASGEAGFGGVVLGGGGGGGGGFSTVGPTAVTPGQTWRVTVPAEGLAAAGSIANPAAVNVATVNSGANGVLDVGGAGGAVGTGATAVKGGDGASATALAGGVGGGGGGAGGIGAAGNTAPGQAGGAAAGTVGLLGYGIGGAGGNGAASGGGTIQGDAPGGGVGGYGNGGAGPDAGQDGLAVIVYHQLAGFTAGGVVSMDPSSRVIVGQGSMNWSNGVVFPMIVDEEEIGSIIEEEWWIVADRAGVPVRITEYLYECVQEEW
jgi:hypothetical protein